MLESIFQIQKNITSTVLKNTDNRANDVKTLIENSGEATRTLTSNEVSASTAKIVDLLNDSFENVKITSQEIFRNTTMGRKEDLKMTIEDIIHANEDRVKHVNATFTSLGSKLELIVENQILARKEALEQVTATNNYANTRQKKDRDFFFNLTSNISNKMKDYNEEFINTVSGMEGAILNSIEPHSQMLQKLNLEMNQNTAVMKNQNFRRQKILIDRIQGVKQDIHAVATAHKFAVSSCIPDWPILEWSPKNPRADKKANGFGVYGNYFRYVDLEHSVQSMRDYFTRVLGYRQHRQLPKPIPANTKSYLPLRRLKWKTHQIDMTSMTNRTKGLGFLQPTDYKWVNVMFSDGQNKEINSDVAMFSWYSADNSHKDWERSDREDAKYSIIQEGFGIAVPERIGALNAVIWGWSLGRKKWVKLAQVKSDHYIHSRDDGNEWFKNSWEQFWTEGYHVSKGEGKYCTWDSEAIDAIGFSVF